MVAKSSGRFVISAMDSPLNGIIGSIGAIIKKNIFLPFDGAGGDF